MQPSCQAAALAWGLVYRMSVTACAWPWGWEQELPGAAVCRGEMEQGP